MPRRAPSSIPLVLVSVLAVVLTACGERRGAVRAPAVPRTTHDDPGRGAAAGGRREVAPPVAPPPAATRPDQTGLATWYGSAFAGHKTANGELFDPSKLIAAHRKLPFGTWVEVRRVETGRTVRVRINDRGPWGHADRIIDLSKRAAQELGIVRDGVAKVELRVVPGP
jgi:rare lipoprotein A